MRAKCCFLIFMVSLCFSSSARADRPLDRSEILQIFEDLTRHPQMTWIPCGVIKATHEEYRAATKTDPDAINALITEKVSNYRSNTNKHELSQDLVKMKLDAIPFNVRYQVSNEYTMKSTVLMRYDGNRFYWEINVESRTDSVRPDDELAYNFMTDHFDLRWNKNRIFAWDGEKYTIYSKSGNHAEVDTTGSIPHVVNGPLTAGLIPWGYGCFSYENLCAAESSAVEKSVEGQKRIRLTINNMDGSEMIFLMDPDREYAVLSSRVKPSQGPTASNHYSDYQRISDRWVPTDILITQHDPESEQLLGYDLWHLTEVSCEVPAGPSFACMYEPGALVEYRSYLTDRPLMYRYSQAADTEGLLAKRLTVAALEGKHVRNCATLALGYVSSLLGKEVSEEELSNLVQESNNSTTLFALKSFAEELDLHCLPVITDIESLSNLPAKCKAILHIPGRNHFVVLGDIDSKYVWSIDLASRNFYYRTDRDFFSMDWVEGVALLISDQPIQILDGMVLIEDDKLRNIIGGSGYTCTRLLQEAFVIYCDYIAGGCEGWFEIHYERWGCEPAETGSCTGSWMIRYVESPCIDNPYYPGHCAITGEWTYRYMRACA